MIVLIFRIYTDHGHCGIVNDDGTVNNSASIEAIAEMALAFAQAGKFHYPFLCTTYLLFY